MDDNVAYIEMRRDSTGNGPTPIDIGNQYEDMRSCDAAEIHRRMALRVAHRPVRAWRGRVRHSDSSRAPAALFEEHGQQDSAGCGDALDERDSVALVAPRSMRACRRTTFAFKHF